MAENYVGIKIRLNIERMFSWIFSFKKLVVLYEFKAENFLGMLKIGAIIILLRYL